MFLISNIVILGRRLFIPLIATVVVFFIIVSTKKVADPFYDQWMIEDIENLRFQPPPGRSIFFHETSCSRPDSDFRVMNLTARQACAIESAALHNPNLEVFLIYSCPTLRPLSGSQQILVDIIKSYKNVQIRQLNLWKYAEGTPVEDWVKKDELQSSRYPMQHTSDLLRLISLYRFGGIYMDTDVIVLRSLEDVPLNYICAEHQGTLGNAVISLAPNGVGHEIGKLFLDHYQQHYSKTAYVDNGPTLVSTVIAKFCGKKPARFIKDWPESCQGFRIFDPTAFYPIPWQSWAHYTDPKFFEKTMAVTKDSYAAHIWNVLNGKVRVKIGSNTALDKIAAMNCPKIYATINESF